MNSESQTIKSVFVAQLSENGIEDCYRDLDNRLDRFIEEAISGTGKDQKIQNEDNNNNNNINNNINTLGIDNQLIISADLNNNNNNNNNNNKGEQHINDNNVNNYNSNDNNDNNFVNLMDDDDDSQEEEESEV